MTKLDRQRLENAVQAIQSVLHADDWLDAYGRYCATTCMPFDPDSDTGRAFKAGYRANTKGRG